MLLLFFVKKKHLGQDHYSAYEEACEMKKLMMFVYSGNYMYIYLGYITTIVFHRNEYCLLYTLKWLICCTAGYADVGVKPGHGTNLSKH